MIARRTWRATSSASRVPPASDRLAPPGGESAGGRVGCGALASARSIPGWTWTPPLRGSSNRVPLFSSSRSSLVSRTSRLPAIRRDRLPRVGERSAVPLASSGALGCYRRSGRVLSAKLWHRGIVCYVELDYRTSQTPSNHIAQKLQPIQIDRQFGRQFTRIRKTDATTAFQPVRHRRRTLPEPPRQLAFGDPRPCNRIGEGDL